MFIVNYYKWSSKTSSPRRKKKQSRASLSSPSQKDSSALASAVPLVSPLWSRLCPRNTLLRSYLEHRNWQPSQVCHYLLPRKHLDSCCVCIFGVRTGFLIGFRKQIKNMADMDRRIASIVFIGALIGTLVAAIVFGSQLLVFLFLAVQIPAYIWYCASYIPFARSCIRSCLRKCFKKA